MSTGIQASDDNPKVPPQRKTTLKWGENGELSPVDMARVLSRLKDQDHDLTECKLSDSSET